MKLQIIVGSTRPNRVSDRVAKWIQTEAETSEGAEVQIVDLADYDLPFLDEPISPQYNPERKPNPIAQRLLDTLTAADAYVIVSPEYNRSISSALKNALDYVDFQFARKPVALVTHGSTGGAQALDSLRSIIPALKAVTVPTPVYLVGRAGNLIDEDGVLSEELKANPYGPQAVLKGVLEDTRWYSDALLAAR